MEEIFLTICWFVCGIAGTHILNEIKAYKAPNSFIWLVILGPIMFLIAIGNIINQSV